MRRILAIFTGLALASCGAEAQKEKTLKAAKLSAAPEMTQMHVQQWQPGEGLTQIPLWPERAAIARPETDQVEGLGVGGKPVAGRQWLYVANVSRPTMTIYPPKGRNTGAAMMVFPGGGYEVLAIDLEGSEICDWVTTQGMTCILLKYRVPQYWHKDPKHEQAPKVQLALQDAQRAMGLVRQRAADLKIDPRKIGVIGFSAGGHLATAISNAGARTYPPVDAADRQSARPDFAIALYPGHLWSGQGMSLHPWNTISAKAPPTLLIHAKDDPVDDVRNATAYAGALRKAKVPVDIRLFDQGGHGFGLRPGPNPITKWPSLAEAWLRTNHFL